MKYILCYEKNDDIFTEEFETLEAAVDMGNICFEHLTAYDKKHCDGYYVLESVNEDPDAVDHMDGNIVKRWK